MKLYIGLMSGTSMDGIDVALVDVDNNTLIGGITCPYSADTQSLLRTVLNNKLVEPGVLCQLNTILGVEFAKAVKTLLDTVKVKASDVIAIGSHGQTICHDATANIPYTLQLGCGHTIATMTGIPVVADFRTRDIVMGGQGAPFAPVYHQVLFHDVTAPVAVVNIGGIANVTFLTQDKAIHGYDTGPGNGLMDDWIYRHLGLAYDKNGDWSAQGKILNPLLTSMLDDVYFKLPAPKSLDKAYFSYNWLSQYLHGTEMPQDIQATLRALTAMSISDAIKTHEIPVKQVYICGGGVHNLALMNDIRAYLPDVCVESTDYLGINPDFLEAMMFAWLADKTINQTPVDLTNITGAKKPAILGVIYR